VQKIVLAAEVRRRVGRTDHAGDRWQAADGSRPGSHCGLSLELQQLAEIPPSQLPDRRCRPRTRRTSITRGHAQLCDGPANETSEWLRTIQVRFVSVCAGVRPPGKTPDDVA